MASALYAQACSFPSKVLYGERFLYFPVELEQFRTQLKTHHGPNSHIPLLHCPTLSTLPSPLVYYGGNVTLKCQGQVGSDRFQLWKDGELIEDRNVSHSLEWFLLKNVNEMNFKGSYSCHYRLGNSWSEYSKPLFLMMDGVLPKPTLWAQPGPVVAPGTNITLWCSKPKLSSVQEWIFTLWKDEMQLPLQQHLSAESQNGFLLSSVSPEDTGSYKCAYKEQNGSNRRSKMSDALELVVPVSKLKCSPGLLRILDSYEVEIMGSIPMCVKGAGRKIGQVMYHSKIQGEGLEEEQPHGFPVYISDLPSLTLWGNVFPKASLSVWPGPEVASGTNVTLLCKGPSWSTGFLLHKEGDDEILHSTDIIQDGAQFFFPHVTTKHTGNYTCSYQPSTNGSLWTQHSDPVELTVRGERKKHAAPTRRRTLLSSSVPRIILIITLSFVSIFPLCIALLAFLYCSSIPMGAFLGNRPRRCLCCPCLPQTVSLSQPLEAPREETPYAEVANKRPRERLVTMTKDAQEVTYTQLNIKTLKKKQTDSKKEPIESIVYATVSLESGFHYLS
ncbi:leukocyte immunoglobulin-like receptor subfamily B member 3 [Monodelphis domestica]|uniref:leukocyte immunoglobulin-like receptor subfamily B member 3 n=1 Tax=Monodelphis domestica TaxID=13616 RepID=UPI0024E2135D|nr:leukocyte immunoglobulin-like receptor subfamily B member 3 [Monodelphis domestica]